MTKIFMSYSRADSKIVSRLIGELEAAGYQVWVDRVEIRGGEIWRREIVNAVDTSDVMVLVLSNHSIESDNVRRELDLAESGKLRILPIEIEPVTIPPEFRYQLVGIQRINLYKNYDQGLRELLGALGQDLPTLLPQKRSRVHWFLLNRLPGFIKNHRRITAFSAVIVLLALSFGAYWATQIYLPSLNTGDCPPKIGQQVNIPKGINAFSQHDVTVGGITHIFSQRTSVYVIHGKEWGIIVYGTKIGGWWWEVSDTPDGNSLGWVWEGQIEECQ